MARKKKAISPSTVITNPTPSECVAAYSGDNRIHANGHVLDLDPAASLEAVYGYIFNGSFPNGQSIPPKTWPTGAPAGRVSGSYWYFDNSAASGDLRVSGARVSCVYDYFTAWALYDDGSDKGAPRGVRVLEPAHVRFRAYHQSSGSGGCTPIVSLPIYKAAPRFYALNVTEAQPVDGLGKGSRKKRETLLSLGEMILTHDETSPAGIPTWRKFGIAEDWTVMVTEHEGALRGVVVWRPGKEFRSPQVVWDTAYPASTAWRFSKMNTLDLQPGGPKWARGVRVTVERA